MKICTLSPGGNGITNGGITQFSGILKSVGVDNFFWELSPGSWNSGDFAWEGEPFKLENSQDETDLANMLEKYDVVLLNLPMMKDREHEMIKVYRVWQKLVNPLRVVIPHNSMADVVFKENMSPLIYAASDYIFTLNPENATIPQEILTRIPKSREKLVNFRLFINLAERMSLVNEFSDFKKKEDYALWVGRFEMCRNTGRLADLVRSINASKHKSTLDFYAMGLSNDTMTYWQFFNTYKEVARLSTYGVSSEVEPERMLLTAEGLIDHKKVSTMYEADDSINRLKVFGKYKHKEGMRILAASKFGVNTYGPWNEKMVPVYSGGDKLENATIEIMTYSLPVFDHRYLKNLDSKELFESPYVIKLKHDATPEENLVAIQAMEKLAGDEKLYAEAREWSLDYIKRKHTVDSFIELVKQCHAKGKTEKASEKEVLKALYGKDTELENDMWVSFHHSQKGEPQYWSYVTKMTKEEIEAEMASEAYMKKAAKGKAKPFEMKRVIASRKKQTELF